MKDGAQLSGEIVSYNQGMEEKQLVRNNRDDLCRSFPTIDPRTVRYSLAFFQALCLSETRDKKNRQPAYQLRRQRFDRMQILQP